MGPLDHILACRRDKCKCAGVSYVGNIVSSEENLCNWLLELLEELIPESNQPALTHSCDSLLQVNDNAARNGKRPTCAAERRLGLLSMFSLRRPIPIAPEETKMTRWPNLRSFIHVSTIIESVDSRGSWVTSSQMDDVPV